MQNGAWTLLTLLLMAVVYVRNKSDRAHLRLSLFLLVLLLAIIALHTHSALLSDTIPPSVLSGLLDLAAGLLLIRIWGVLVFKLLLPLLRLHPPGIIADITVTIAYLVWGGIRLHLAGMAVGDIVTTSAVLTAVIAFALQDTLGNLLAGIAIQLDDSIKVGDWVEHEGVIGRVAEINWRAASLETRNWETVVVPNSLLLKNRFMVLGKRQHEPVQLRRWIWFDLTLETLPNQIITLIEQALKDTGIPNVAKTPAPSCVLMKVENGVARYAVRYWLTDLRVDDPTDSAVRTHIDATLRRNDRRITPPIYHILMTKENEAVDVRHKRHTAERMNNLHKLSLFSMLSEDELLALADQLKFTPFVAGDTMMQQGVVSEWLFVMTSGQAEILVSQPGHAPVVLDKLDPGDFFGEMGLLTGEASAYSVRAVGATECYRLGKETFQKMFLARAQLVGALSDALQTRLKEQRDLLEHMDLQAPNSGDGVILAKLRRYFGLE